jgi:NAD(P)-dependent dehydrogenase (short-subunit alcohol dehydrogenase family)
MVEHFALQGAKVAFVDLAADPAHELIRQLTDRCAHPPRFWSCDLRDVARIKTVIGEIEGELGAIRVLVNNAENDDRHKFEDVTRLTPTLGHELGVSNIRVNCVFPGAVLTERQRELWWTPEYEKQIIARQALKRSLMPDDVARLVLFLASDDSRAITNQSHLVDAGWV